MQTDEQSIRALIDTWLSASQAGDLETLLTLMADDVIFMVPGKEPFGKEAFASAFRSGAKTMDVTGTSKIQELEVLGNWAWMRNRLEITITTAGGASVTHTGYTLTILRKNADRWVITRDANLLTPGHQPKPTNQP